jgi:signal transduction histidine kinase
MKGLRRLRSVRARIALACACLFLVAGATLIGVTYVLVDHSLANTPARSGAQPDPQLLQRCKQAPDRDASFQTKCKTAFAAGAAQGAKVQGELALSQLLTYSLASLGGLTVLAGVLGWAVAGRVLRPLHAVTEAARGASEHNLGERLALQGPRDELKELADTFDGMLDRLDAAFVSQRRFVANASHELRTPLTVMRTAIDVTLAKPDRDSARLEAMAVDVRQAVDRAEQLIDALLTLARSDRGVTGREFVDLATAAEDAIDTTRAELAGIAIHAALSPAELHGDRVLLERMVANLVQNAARHNVPGGWLRLATGSGDGRVWLVIANGGGRLADDVVPTLFEPFRRLSERVGSDRGVGLGLSIVRSVATSHGGDVRARALPEGGLELAVSLPTSVRAVAAVGHVRGPATSRTTQISLPAPNE